MQGIKNGDRSFKVEITAGTNIGTYHAIDGQRVTLRYPGQLQTCARCHETAVVCRGGAIARRCEAAQGEKVEFSDYILKLWQKIGYVPGEIEMAAVYDEHSEYPVETDGAVQQVGGIFTPPKQTSEPEKFSGVSIKQFPKDTDDGDIIEFLVNAGLPETLKDTVGIKNNGSVDIRNLDNAVCLKLISHIHHQVHFGKRLFCNGFIALTPQKEAEAVDEIQVTGSTGSFLSLPVSTGAAVSGSGSSSSLPEVSLSVLTTPSTNTSPVSVSQLVRRYSMSMTDCPPAESIAADILNTRKTLLSDIKDLKDQLSDFGSCVSEQPGSSSDESDRYSVGSKKVSKLKRKAGKTPIKSDEKLKKPTLDWFDKANDGLTH